MSRSRESPTNSTPSREGSVPRTRSKKSRDVKQRQEVRAAEEPQPGLGPRAQIGHDAEVVSLRDAPQEPLVPRRDIAHLMGRKHLFEQLRLRGGGR